MFQLFAFSALFLGIVSGGQFTETPTQRAVRLAQQASNLTMMSPDERVFTSLLEGDTPVLRVDNKNATQDWVALSQKNSEWGMELYSIGFKRYLITNEQQYWVLDTGEKGFGSRILGPFPYANLPQSENLLVESNSKIAVAAKAQFKQDMKDLKAATTPRPEPVHPPPVRPIRIFELAQFGISVTEAKAKFSGYTVASYTQVRMTTAEAKKFDALICKTAKSSPDSIVCGGDPVDWVNIGGMVNMFFYKGKLNSVSFSCYSDEVACADIQRGLQKRIGQGHQSHGGRAWISGTVHYAVDVTPTMTFVQTYDERYIPPYPLPNF